MYTQTGYDASAHISEETKGAALGAAKGVWRSVFWAGVIGWFVLLAITFAATEVGVVTNERPRLGSLVDLRQLARPVGGEDGDPDRDDRPALLRHGVPDQRLAHVLRVLARPRGSRAIGSGPGSNHHRVPAFSVIFMATCALIITLPALIGDENNYTYAFSAVVSIAVIGLYIAYVIPTYLRWRMGDAFEPGPWTLGKKYKWINPAAVIWVIICVIVFSLPQAAGRPDAVRWHRRDFDWKYVNYAPITVLIVIVAVGLWWLTQCPAHVPGADPPGRDRRDRPGDRGPARTEPPPATA